MTTAVLKTCATCGQEKPLDGYYLRPDGRPNGAHCKTCVRVRVKASYCPEKNRAWKKRRNERDPQARLRETLKGLYGITLEEYEAMERAQGGRCAICRGKPRGRRKRLDIDHDHVTGRVRGLLCMRCNRMLGWIGEDATLLRRAIAYLNGVV